MNRIALSALGILAIAVPRAAFSQERPLNRPPAGFTALFNGKDLTGWSMVGPGRFVVENGMLKTEGGMGLLWYTGQQFGNTTLRVVFKTASPNANSGVYIRFPEKPDDLRFRESLLHRPTLSLGRTLNPNATQIRGDVEVIRLDGGLPPGKKMEPSPR